jgi:transposase-like protein
MPVIKKYIKPGSIIYSDNWGAYNTLSSHEYIQPILLIHRTVPSILKI